ncbi:MAG: ABC transporter substrate-binding protein [Christensenellales bacterium]|jgi:peptide/nickel transport system substrate-binding protein
MKKKNLAFLALLVACMMIASFVTGCAPATTEPEATPAPDSEATPVPEEETPGEVATRADGKSYLEYEVIVPGDGVGDHPAFAILTDAQAALASIGIKLHINDPSDSNVLWDALDAGVQDLWTAAWGSTIDPDMYQVYHSSNVPGLGGSDSNHYRITSEKLDQYIMDARTSDDQAYRKAIYKLALDEIADWAVELPTYQRQNCTVFSTQRVKMDTVTPDMTSYWLWMKEAEKIEMVDPNDPLVVAYQEFSEKFSPFFADTGYDMDAVDMTQIAPLTTDRLGGIVFNAIEGETINFNGTDYTYTGPADISVDFDEAANVTTYVIKLRDDLKFSDGKPVTADDLIFTYYVYLDPDYAGSTTLNSYPIIGLKNYMTQTSDEIYAKYSKLVEDIYAAGPDHVWSSADAWTEEMQKYFWDGLTENWKADVAGIVDYVVSKYLNDDYANKYANGRTAADIKDNEKLHVMYGMTMWGFGSFNDEGEFVGAATGKSWTLEGDDVPTVDDFYAETYEAYAGDPDAYAATESAVGADIRGAISSKFITHFGTADPEGEGGVPNIAGIKKLDDYTVQVQTEGYSAPAIYSICSVSIAPLHYYGDPAQYDYENNKFGHPFGDLSVVKEKATVPMGAGPYKFIKFENKTIYYEANEHYYKGAPKTKYVQFKTTTSSEVAAAVAAGTIDAGELTGSRAYFEEIRGYNSNGELTGDVVTTVRVDNLGYGYLGLNAATINVGGDPGSYESKCLRKALATVFAVYRDVAINSYYGDAASVIQYPISNTSWAAPQPTDEGFVHAFSVDVNGNPIYTSDMTQEERYAAAIQAALGYFEAAGFTVKDGKVVAGPKA